MYSNRDNLSSLVDSRIPKGETLDQFHVSPISTIVEVFTGTHENDMHFLQHELLRLSLLRCSRHCAADCLLAGLSSQHTYLEMRT